MPSATTGFLFSSSRVVSVIFPVWPSSCSAFLLVEYEDVCELDQEK
jgi:hypothetical protein